MSTTGGPPPVITATATTASTQVSVTRFTQAVIVTLSANTTVQLVGLAGGDAANIVVVVVQDGTGGRTCTINIGAGAWQAGYPVFPTAAGSAASFRLTTADGGTTWLADQLSRPEVWQTIAPNAAAISTTSTTVVLELAGGAFPAGALRAGCMVRMAVPFTAVIASGATQPSLQHYLRCGPTATALTARTDVGSFNSMGTVAAGTIKAAVGLELTVLDDVTVAAQLFDLGHQNPQDFGAFSTTFSRSGTSPPAGTTVSSLSGNATTISFAAAVTANPSAVSVVYATGRATVQLWTPPR